MSQNHFDTDVLIVGSRPVGLTLASELTRYGASAACLYLIHPDWFVGFRGTLNHAEPLQAYLQQVLIS